MAKKIDSVRKQWEQKFIEKISSVHKRKLNEVAKRILRRVDSTKSGLQTRSKKHNAECNVTLEELRQLTYDYYGTPCKYCGKILTIKNYEYDHIVPMSKGGSSNIDNIQIICKTSNGIKGSLTEDNLKILLAWLDTIPEDLKKDISIRLAGGIR